jgi:hypothetical protein
MKFRMYIDEVGNPDLGSSEDPLHRFLSLTGIIVDLDYVRRVLHPEMEQLKSDYFHSHPDDPVIFHRKELLNAVRPFEALRDPETRSRFDRELLAFLEDWQYTVISVCLDKKSHEDTYRGDMTRIIIALPCFSNDSLSFWSRGRERATSWQNLGAERRACG